MTTKPRARRATFCCGLALGTVVAALLTGCSPVSGPVASSRAGASPASATSASTSPAPSGPATATDAGRRAAGSGPGSASSSSAASSGSAAAGCRNLFATAQIKAQITAVQKAYTQLRYIEPVPGDFFYGSCGETSYAATDFEAAVGAGHAEGVALQDDGSAIQYYARTASGWRHIAADGFPRDARGCAAISQLPAALAALWHGCPRLTRGVPLTYLAATGWSARSPVYRPLSVVLSGDSTFGLQDLHWSVWTTDSASGTGTGWVDDCQPSCATGRISRGPIQVTLTGNDYTCGREFFTRMDITWTGAVPPGLNRRYPWRSSTPSC